MNNRSRIFIRGSDRAGTLVLASPLFRALRNAYPGAHITACCKQATFDLLKNCPYVDEVLLYNPGHLLDTVKFGLMLRKNRYTCAFLLSGSFVSALLCLIARIPERTGYAEDSRALLLTRPLKQDERGHVKNSLLRIVESAGIPAGSTKPELWLTESDKEEAEKLFEENNMTKAAPVIGISLEVKGEPSRRWDDRNFRTLIQKLLSHPNSLTVALFGSPDSGTNGAAVIASLEKHAGLKDLTGKTSLPVFAACLKKCHAYISCDSGGAHIAAAAGTRTFVLFGPMDPSRWGPLGDNVTFLRGTAVCSPCSYRMMRKCRNNTCMRTITPDDVFDAVRRSLP